MDPTPLLFLAAFMVGTAKGGLATVGSLAVPLLALTMNPVEAAATLLPVYIVTDWVSVWLYRRNYSRANITYLLPAMLLGVAIATMIVTVAPEALLLIVTGLIGLWYCLRAWLRRTPARKTDPAPRPALFWGTLAGIASYLTHSAGPPTQAYLLPQQMPKLIYAGTIAIIFAVVNLSKLPGYALAGQFNGLDWTQTPWLIGTGVLGTLAGRWLTEVLPQALYVRVIEILLLALSVILLIRGTTALLT
ncbi:sulfite exporter TauE/SafE family protein [Pseudooceanicola sp. C21-150M6]|uniref:sulfite exporter TauE/SafE family protein n=1 Tax=Pseudooceanicola sp. C21-150M6 TaxID=3434355 RepID=UPI003D8001E1